MDKNRRVSDIIPIFHIFYIIQFKKNKSCGKHIPVEKRRDKILSPIFRGHTTTTSFNNL
jgi:hypothetical protein